MPDRAVLPAAAALFVCAVVGLTLGVMRAGPPGGADESDNGEIVPALTPVSSAKAIVTPAQTMDEAEVRRLAREEATAVLAARAPVKKPKPADTDTDDTDNSIPPGGLVVPLTPAPQPLIPPTGAPQPQG